MSRRREGSSDEGMSAQLGARIRAARKAEQLSLRALAERIQVSPATMSAVENGRIAVSAVRLAHIASELGVSVESLLLPPEDGPHELGHDEGRHWRQFDAEPFDPPLQAALNAFVEVGYHGATMRDIARRAGLSVPGIYHYYASKQEMLVAILDHTMDDLTWRMEAATAESTDLRTRLSLQIECLVLFHTRRREWGFIGLSEQRSVEGEGGERIREKRNAVQRMVTATVKELAAQGRCEATNASGAARAAVLMAMGVTQWFSDDGRQTAEQVAQEYATYALKLIGCGATG